MGINQDGVMHKKYRIFKRCKLRNKGGALQKELQEIDFTKNLTLAHKQSLFRYK